jgi:hypothetical protein
MEAKHSSASSSSPPSLCAALRISTTTYCLAISRPCPPESQAISVRLKNFLLHNPRVVILQLALDVNGQAHAGRRRSFHWWAPDSRSTRRWPGPHPAFSSRHGTNSYTALTTQYGYNTLFVIAPNSYTALTTQYGYNTFCNS